MTGRRRHAAAVIAVTAVAVCGLAIVAAFALAQVDKHQQGTAVVIAVPAAAVIFAVLAWLGRHGGTS